MLSGIDPQWLLKILPKQFAGGARGFLGRIEIMLHQEISRIKNTKCTAEMLERRKMSVSEPVGFANGSRHDLSSAHRS